METGLTSAHLETQCLDVTVGRVRSPRKRMSSNSLILILGIAMLLIVLVFLELRIRHLETSFSAVGRPESLAVGSFSEGLILWPS